MNFSRPNIHLSRFVFVWNSAKFFSLWILLFSFLFLFPSSLLAIDVDSTVITHDDEIDRATRDQIYRLSKMVIESIKADKPDVAIELFDRAIFDEPNYAENMSLLYRQARLLLGKGEVEAAHDYHYVWNGGGERPIDFVMQGANHLVVGLVSSNEIFATLLYTKGLPRDLLFVLLYSRNSPADLWRLWRIDFGEVRVGGRDALQWYREGRQYYESGSLAPAVLRMQLATTILRPSTSFRYMRDSEVAKFANKVFEEAEKSQTLPVEITSIVTKPTLHSIRPRVVGSTLYPVMTFATTLPLSDEAAIDEEALAMIPEVERLFPGLYDGVDRIYFEAYSELPLKSDAENPKYEIIFEDK